MYGGTILPPSFVIRILILNAHLQKHVLALEAAGVREDPTDKTFEEQALEAAIEEKYEETGKLWKPWATNAKSIRLGEFILIVDSDTIVPEVSVLCDVDLISSTDLLAGLPSRRRARDDRVPRGRHHSARVWCVAP